MALLDQAVWIGGSGFGETGTTTISEGGFSTIVAGTFTANAWDPTSGGFPGVSDFGAFGLTSAINANYVFSNPVDNLSFTLDHVSSQGTTYDDEFTIYIYDDNGDLIPSADVIAGLTGVTNATVYANPDGSVVVEADNTTPEFVGINITGHLVSEVDITFDVGPDGTQTGGAGISDFTFDIPEPDTDGDGVLDSADLDTDGDGILDSEEGFSSTAPTTITITFDGDEWSADATDNTRWELYDADGNLIASDDVIDSGVKVTSVDITGLTLGDFQFIVYDDFGDGISGINPASYTVEVDGVIAIDSGPNPDFGGATQVTENFTVTSVITTTDTDGDGIADHLDLDSDNDGITDNVEAQSTDGYVAPTGTDTDGDGLDDAYDATPTTGATGSNGLNPVDTDGDGTDDYIDTDSDNDGIDDVDEAGHGITQAVIDASGDSDFDGIMDAVDDVVGWDVNDNDIDGSGNFTLSDTDGDTPADGTGAIPELNDLDFRDSAPTEAVYDAILLNGMPGDTDLLISGSEMTQVDNTLEFSPQTAGELAVGDAINIGGIVYTISGLHDYEADMVNDNGATSETVHGHIVELDDGNGSTLTYMLIDDSYGPKPDITQAQLLFVDPPAGNPSISDYDADQNVSLTGLNFIVEGTGAGELIDSSYVGDPQGDRIDNNDHSDGSNDDSVVAGAGEDTVVSGVGDDTIDGGSGADSIQAGDGNDIIDGGSQADTIEAGAGNDTVLGGNGTDDVDLGSGDDLYQEGSIQNNGFGSDTIDGGTGNDTILADGGADSVDGGAGNDSIEGGLNNDTLSGGSGDDTIDGGAGNDTLNAGAGSDSLVGGDGNDFLNGVGGSPTSDDTLEGGAGNDTLFGGMGDDLIDGGDGNDVFVLAEGDTATGGDGDDIFYIADYGETGAGTIDIVGGEGAETNGDTLYLGPDVSNADITYTNLDDNAGGLSGSFTLPDGTVVTFDEIENIICFTSGTMIKTDQGERPVESLKQGDMIITRDHGPQPLGWVGTTTVPGRGKFAPVRLASHVTGARRSLLVSPQHRMLFEGYECELFFGSDEVLATATHLEDGHSVVREPRALVTYIHLMLDQHEIIYAEGAPTESFFAGDMGLAAISALSREELFKAYPKLRDDPTSYGPTARICLKAHEAQLLMQERVSLPMAA